MRYALRLFWLYISSAQGSGEYVSFTDSEHEWTPLERRQSSDRDLVPPEMLAERFAELMIARDRPTLSAPLLRAPKAVDKSCLCSNSEEGKFIAAATRFRLTGRNRSQPSYSALMMALTSVKQSLTWLNTYHEDSDTPTVAAFQAQILWPLQDILLLYTMSYRHQTASVKDYFMALLAVRDLAVSVHYAAEIIKIDNVGSWGVVQEALDAQIQFNIDRLEALAADQDRRTPRSSSCICH